MKKNIGIVGYWYATNYGSVITYYALHLVLKKLGFFSELIDCPEKERDHEGENVFSRIFLKNHVSISKSYKWDELSKLNDFYDIFVVGSDQVWTRDAIRIMKYMFFLNFVSDDKRKIAYAPSFGSNIFEPTLEEKNNVEYLLKRFDAVSVRESQAVEILNRFGISAQHVLDPVFLIDEYEYNKVASESKLQISEPYILCYILDPKIEKENIIKRIQVEYNMKVVLVLDGRKGTQEKNKEKLVFYKKDVLDYVDEPDWVRLFKNATYVVTDSHHGLAMSIIYKKQFTCIANRERGYERFVSLLSLLDLKDRLIEKKDEINDDFLKKKIDYFKVGSLLNINIKKSISWLEESLRSNRINNSVIIKLNLKEECNGCSLCESICPSNAITMITNKDGFFNPTINKEKCINCGLCYKNCNSLNAKYTNFNPIVKAVMANDQIRSVSSSGGVFTVLAEFILNNNGIVYGAKLNSDFSVSHIGVKSINDLNLLRGSKYIQSSLSNIYPQIKNLLDEDNYVLFSGLPCQVSALKLYLKKDYEKLLCVDLLCHGISSLKVFKKYIKDCFGDKEIKNVYFKAKKPWGWHPGMNIIFTDNSLYQKKLEEDPFYLAYINGLSKNKCCGECKYNRIPRQGDLTIGDFWHIEDFNKNWNDYKGTSLVLINNKKGEEFYKNVEKNFILNNDAPLNVALRGNPIISRPYKLPFNRDSFFSELDKSSFANLSYNYVRVNQLNNLSAPIFFDENMKEMFLISKIIFKNYNNRKILFWGNNELLKNILLKYFNIKISGYLSSLYICESSNNVLSFDSLLHKENEYFIVVLEKGYSLNLENDFRKLGFVICKDYLFRQIKPVILENYDLSLGYNDIYGNTVSCSKGIIKKIILRGANNKISIENNVFGLNNLIVDLSANSSLTIKSGTNFTQQYTTIDTKGYNGDAKIFIGRRCIFMTSLLRCYVDKETTMIRINEGFTSSNGLEMRAFTGNKIIIGKDSMVSYDVVFLAGDAHTIYDSLDNHVLNHPKENKNKHIVLGDHVWVGIRSMLLRSTRVGHGCIIGANSTIKKIFSNNTTIVGTPGNEVRRNVCWNREMYPNNLTANRLSFKTGENPLPLVCSNVLVIGGTQNNGIALVNELLYWGNSVTIATRGKHSDPFGNYVKRIKIDISNSELMKKAFTNQKYDVVFNNLAYCSNYVKNVLDFVKCKRYVQLSSVMVYDKEFHLNLKEKDFKPNREKLIWCDKGNDYSFGKRQSEIVLFKKYKKINFVSIRIPYVIPTERMNFYIDSVLNNKPMNIKNLDNVMSFVKVEEVGKFLVYIASQPYKGVLNLSSDGYISHREIISYIEKKVGKNAIFDNSSQNVCPFNSNSFSLNNSLIKKCYFHNTKINDWFWRYVDSILLARGIK